MEFFKCLAVAGYESTYVALRLLLSIIQNLLRCNLLPRNKMDTALLRQLQKFILETQTNMR